MNIRHHQIEGRGRPEQAPETCPFTGATASSAMHSANSAQAPAPKATQPPPGDMGLPFLGKMREFGSDPFAFTLNGTRKYGNVWKTRLLGSTVVFFAGPRAFSFFMDPANFSRKNATAKFIQALLHPDAVPFLEGAPHKRRKRLLLEAFTDPAIDSYLPHVFSIMERYATAWVDQERAIGREVKQLVFDIVNMLFAGGDPRKTDYALTDDFTKMVRGTFSAPINLPGTNYRKAIEARDRLRAYFRKQVAENDGAGTALGIFKQARGPNGEQLSAHEIEVELLHFFFAATAALSAAIAWSIAVLGENPELAGRLRAEADRVLGDGTPTLVQIRELALANQVAREVLRAYPMTSTTFVGTAMRDLEFDGFRIRAGWKGIGLTWATQQDAGTYQQPSRFDPDRLTDEAMKALPNSAYVPMGSGPRDGHRCAGEEFVKAVLPGFIGWFAREHTWTWPAGQDLSPGPGSVGPLPRGGLHIHLHQRRCTDA
jgi:cytochrome P450